MQLLVYQMLSEKAVRASMKTSSFVSSASHTKKLLKQKYTEKFGKQKRNIGNCFALWCNSVFKNCGRTSTKLALGIVANTWQINSLAHWTRMKL